MKQLSGRQVIIMYVLYSIALKFLTVPSLMAEYSGRDTYIAMFVACLIEFAMLMCTLLILNKLKNTSLKDALSLFFGKVIGKVICSILCIMFLLQTMLVSKQFYFLLSNSLYESISFNFFILPLLVLAVYFCIAGKRAIFRSAEIFYIFVLIAVVVGVFTAAEHIKPNSLLPVLEEGFNPVLKSVFYNIQYFGAFMFLLLFAGKIEITKKTNISFAIVGVIICLVAVFIGYMFYGVYGDMATIKNLAIINFTQFTSYTSKNGRLDWLVIAIWIVALVFQFCLSFYCMYICAKKIVPSKKIAPHALLFAALIFVLNGYVFTSANILYAFVNYFIVAIFVFTIGVPLLIMAAVLLGRKKLNLTKQTKGEKDEKCIN